MLPWPIAGNTLFFLPAWQALFLTALVIGYHRERIGARLARLSPVVTLATTGALATGIVGLYFTPTAGFTTGGAVSGPLFSKASVGPGRVAVFAVLAVFAFTALTLLWTPVRRMTGWLLLPLGHHALTAYALHIFLVALAARGIGELYGGRTPDAGVTTLVQLAAIAVVWGVIVLWPALAGWADNCRHCLVVHAHGRAHPWPARLSVLFREGGEPHDRAAHRARDAAADRDAAGIDRRPPAAEHA